MYIIIIIIISIRIFDDCSKGTLLPLPLDACRYLLLSIALPSVAATISHTSVIKKTKKKHTQNNYRLYVNNRAP